MLDIAKLYRASLGKQVMLVVLAILGFYAIQFALIFVASIIVTFAVGMTQGISTVEATASSGNFVALMSIIGICGGALMMFVLRGKKLITTDITYFNEKIKIRDLFMIVVLMFAVQAVTSIGGMLIELFLQIFGFSMLDDYADSIGMLNTVLGTVYIVLVGPVVEEVIFRAGIMRSLERYGVNFAIILSSIIFGAYHIFIYQGCFAFMLGILLAYVAQRFSIKWAILLHILNNLYSVVLGLLSGMDEAVATFVSLFIFGLYLVSIIGAILILVMNSQRIKAQLAARRPASMLYLLGIPRQAAVPAAAVASDWAAPGIPGGVSGMPGTLGSDALGMTGMTAAAPAVVSTPPAGYEIPIGYTAPATPCQPVGLEEQAAPYPPAVVSTPTSAYPPVVSTMPAEPVYQFAPQSSRKSPTGIMPPLAQPDEPKPHPFLVAFSNPLFIFALALVLVINVVMIVT